MSEKEEAIELANRVLDTPHRDPDDDLSMMSRQFLRALEPAWRDIETAPVTPDNRMRVLGYGFFQDRPARSVQIMEWVGWIGKWSVSALPFTPTHWHPLPSAPHPNADEGERK